MTFTAPREGAMPTSDVNLRLNEFLLTNKVKLRINDAAREHGQIRAFQNNTYDITKVVPTVVMRNEDYGRIARILADGTPVELAVHDRQQDLPGRQDGLQHDFGDRRVRQEGRSRDARRPPRLVALRHRRHRQRHRLRGDDGSGAHSQGDRRAAAAHDSRRAVERRGAGAARLAGLRQGALRIVRSAEARVREARRLPEHRFGHRPRARRRRLRTAGSRPRSSASS